MASAWGGAELTTRHAICNPLGHGWFVDRARFDFEVLAEATAGGAVPILYGRIRSASRTRKGWLLCFSTQPVAEGQVVINANVVVDASGRSSAFARMIGIRRIALDRLVCLTANAIPADFPPGEALVESTEAGWWFSAMNPSGNLSISFFTNPRGPSLEEALRATIHTSKRILRVLPGRNRSRAARTDWLKVPASDGWLAVGDAAFASDPLGSQGLLRALETAENAAAIIIGSSAYNREAVQQYCEIHVDYLGRFLRDRAHFYFAERRWPEAPFWRSAHAALGEVPAK
jgi:flavin-dependent dehydrogenase